MDIVTPTIYHHSLAAPALKAGLHVFVEKPITKTLVDADDLIRLAKENDRVLQVGHIERFNSAIMELRKILGNRSVPVAARIGLSSYIVALPSRRYRYVIQPILH